MSRKENVQRVQKTEGISDELDYRLSIRLTPEIAARIDAIAERKFGTRSSVVRECIALGLEKLETEAGKSETPP